MDIIIDKIKSSIDINEKPKNLRIFEFTKIINPEYLTVGDNVTIDDFCLLYAKPDAPIKIGSFVHIASFSSITGGPVTIGNFVSIASGSRVLAASEDYRDGALINATIPEKYRILDRSGCVFEDHCFIGANCVVFPGVTIGEGAVVAAGAVIRQNLDPWSIYLKKNDKLVKWIKSRDKEKTYENVKKLLNEHKEINLMK